MHVCLSVSLSGYLLPNYLTNFSRHSLTRKLTKMRRELNLKIIKIFYILLNLNEKSINFIGESLEFETS